MKSLIIIAASLILISGCTKKPGPVLAEKLDRGVIALQTDENHAYVGWRLLKEDPAGF